MEISEFKTFPDHAKLWIYGFDGELGFEEKQMLFQGLTQFIKSWNTHGKPVQGAFNILHNRFVFISGFTDEGISGCSIDSSVQSLQNLSQNLGIGVLDGQAVFYRDSAGVIGSANRDGFQIKASNGQIEETTPVFDLTFSQLGDLRQGSFEKPFKDSWHRRVFDLAETTVQ